MRSRVWSVGIALAVVVIVVTAPAARGAITEKAAIKQVKAAVKTRLGLFASALAAARLTVGARVDAFEVAAANGFSVAEVQPLVDDLATFQAAVQEALFDVAVDLAADGKTALAALADGSPLAAIPPAFANLPGGIPDQTRAAIAKLLAKTYRAVNKRLAKTSTLVGKDGDATFFAVVDAPPQLFFAFSDSRSDAILFGFALDLRVSASTTTPDATRLWAGGTTAIAGLNLAVSAIPMIDGALGEDVQVTSEGRGRFLAAFGNTTPLPRSNYLVGAAAGLSASAPSSFAIR